MVLPIREKPFEEKVHICKFPGCGVHFLGKGRSKYCKEHRDKKYHNQLYFDKYKKEEDKKLLTENQLIQHDFFQATLSKHKCNLEGCGEEFDIILQPRVFIYPKYCPEHRNEWKRKLFLKNICFETKN